MSEQAARPRFSLGERHRALQWGSMLALSALFILLLELLHIPAALLIGPMVAAILVSLAEGAIRVPQWPFYVSQGVIGCMIARSITPDLLAELVEDWPLFLATIFSVVAMSSLLGLLLARWQVLPGSVAIWGSFPGAASAMMIMADAYGSDIRLVAFMQYLRVMFVAIFASAVARLWTAGSGGSSTSLVWFPEIVWPGFLATLAVILGSVVLARTLRIPAGPMVVPLFVAVTLQDTGFLTIQLPPWLLAITYAVIGWSIGLRFTPAIFRHAARAMPRVAASILVLIAACGGLAFLLVLFFDVDPLSAYLATSPGGADAVAIIAASSNVDLPFVMSMQVGRFLVVLILGPAIARMLVHLIRPSPG